MPRENLAQPPRGHPSQYRRTHAGPERLSRMRAYHRLRCAVRLHRLVEPEVVFSKTRKVLLQSLELRLSLYSA